MDCEREKCLPFTSKQTLENDFFDDFLGMQPNTIKWKCFLENIFSVKYFILQWNKQSINIILAKLYLKKKKTI